LPSYKISGQTGFIGKALKAELQMVESDNPDYYFHFASPSSQRLFDEDYHCIKETIDLFIEACEFCKRHRCKLIFPSSGTVYTSKDSYSYTKKALEKIVEAYNIDYLAVRIFAGYGDESHKRNYASPLYQFCKSMVNGERPVIWGDGTQTRDFVYIDDIVKAIIRNRDTYGIMDIGTGVSTSFNDVVGHINSILKTNIEPIYIPKPQRYITETKCLQPLREYTPIYKGILKVVRRLQYENTRT
jgi:UDP-glucose 4-epimerase